MKESIPLLTAHLRVSITEDETDSGEEVALSRAIASNDHIMLWRERLNNGLIFVTTLDISIGKLRHRCGSKVPFEALYDYLFDVHLE